MVVQKERYKGTSSIALVTVKNQHDKLLPIPVIAVCVEIGN